MEDMYCTCRYQCMYYVSIHQDCMIKRGRVTVNAYTHTLVLHEARVSEGSLNVPYQLGKALAPIFVMLVFHHGLHFIQNWWAELFLNYCITWCYTSRFQPSSC